MFKTRDNAEIEIKDIPFSDLLDFNWDWNLFIRKSYMNRLLLEAVNRELLTKAEYDEYLNIPRNYDLLEDIEYEPNPIDYIFIYLGSNRHNVENEKFRRYIKTIKTLLPNYEFDIYWFIDWVHPLIFKHNIVFIIEYVTDIANLHHAVANKERIDLLHVLYTKYPNYAFDFRVSVDDKWSELNV